MTLPSRSLSRSHAHLWSRSARRCFHLSLCPSRVRVCHSKLRELKLVPKRSMDSIRVSEALLAHRPPLALEDYLFAKLSQPFKERRMTKTARAGWTDSTHALRVDPQNSEDSIHRRELEATLSSHLATIPIRHLAWKRRDHMSLVNLIIAECSIR